MECHPYLNQSKLLSFCSSRSITLTAYSPLGSPVKLLDDDRLAKISENHGKSTAQVVLRWQVQRGVIVIPKSVTASRIVENSQIMDFRLTDDEMRTIDSFHCDGRIIRADERRAHPDYPFNIEF